MIGPSVKVYVRGRDCYSTATSKQQQHQHQGLCFRFLDVAVSIQHNFIRELPYQQVSGFNGYCGLETAHFALVLQTVSSRVAFIV